MGRKSSLDELCYLGQQAGGVTPPLVWAHTIRTHAGRARSSLRSGALSAIGTSPAPRRSVRERSLSPITCLKRPILASTNAC